MADKPLTLQEKMVHQVGFANAALEKAAAFKTAQEKVAADCAALIPDTVKALIANERILPGQEKEAAEALKDPRRALQILTKVAAHRNASEANQLGHGVDAKGNTKTASAAAPASRSGGMKESDRKLWGGLGLQVPTE